MKTTIISRLFSFSVVALLVFSAGCVKENFEEIPKPVYVSQWSVNTTIAQVKGFYGSAVENIRTLATAKGVAAGDIIIEGLVTSNDSCANFYKTVTIQDATGGIDIKVNDSDLYSTYNLKPGQKVVMRLNDLYLDNYKGVFQIGIAIVDNGSKTLSEINLDQLSKHMEKVGIREQMVPEELTISQINSGGAPFVQKLVKVNGVQFLDATKGYSIPGENTNRTLIDIDKNMLALRTSGFAKFKETIVPSGSGSITGILSIYNGTYQLYIRDLNDVQLNQDRMGGAAPAANKTIGELKAVWTGGLKQITEDIIVEGVVNSDDEFGNIYKQIFIQDANDAIEVKIDAGGLYPEFPVGTKIRINCNGLYLGMYGGVIQLGGVYNNAIGRMSAIDLYKRVSVIESGVAVAPVETNLAGLSSNMVGKLIKLNDMLFPETELNKTWAEVGVTTNRNLVDKSGAKVIVRTSGYAAFAGTKLPTGEGSIVAVLTKFNSDYQLVVRDLRDVKLDKNPRKIQVLFKQDFSSLVKFADVALVGWTNFAEAGSKKWRGNEFSANKYAEMTAYQSGEASNIVWLITPSVALPAEGLNALSFSAQWHHWVDGTKLEVYASSDYDGTNVGTATWTALSARVPQNADGQYTWVNSGSVDLSAYAGKKVYIAFKYTGSTTASTGFNVDDISLVNKQ